jgi:serine/threonine protein kinase
MSIDDYKIIKELGSGVFGTTYLVKKDNKEYALKIEKILEKDIKEDLSSPVWREIDFAKNLGNLYPDQFMKLYDYDIIDNCTHNQKYPDYVKYFIKELQDSLSEKTQSIYCSRKVYSLIDTTLEYLIKKKLKDQNQIYSIIIQICYIVYLMNAMVILIHL